MRRALAIAVCALTFVAVAGCGGGHGNQDPRKGRVVTRDSNCLWGTCEYDWKACIGSDLIVHLDGLKSDHTIKNSRECSDG